MCKGSGVGGSELCHRSESRLLRWGTESMAGMQRVRRVGRPQELGNAGAWGHAKRLAL